MKGHLSLAVVALCTLVGMLLFAPHLALADEADQSVVRVGYYENEVFQEGARPDAVKTGYAYEYYRKLSEYTGWQYSYEYGSFGDLYQMLLDGKIDLLAGLAWREDREGVIGYPEAAMGNEIYSLVKHSASTDITTEPTSLTGKTIGVLNSAMVGVLDEWLQSNHVAAEVIHYTDYEELFAAFDDNRIDILAAEGDGAYDRLNAEVLCAFGTSDYYLCVNIKRPDLLAKLNEAQAQLAVEEPNYLNTLRNRYHPVSVSSRSFSAAEREWLSAHDTLSIGYLNNYLPYSDTDEQGNVTGIVKDLLPAIFANLGISHVEITYTGFESYDAMVAAVNEERIDAAFPVGGGLYYSEENGIYQSNAVVSTLTELVYKGDYTDETTRTFAINENNRMQYYYVLTYYPKSEVMPCPSIEDCLEAVLAGKASCTTLNGLRANDILKNPRYRDLSMKQLSRSDDRCFGVRIGNEGLLKLLNRGTSVLGEDYAQNAAYRYTNELYKESFIDVLRRYMGIFGSLLVGVAAVIIFLLARDARRTKEEMRDKEQARLALEATNKELAESREALSEALVVADHANHAKTVFLNNMSHDIRTPLNAIVGFTTLAATHLDDQELARDFLDNIVVSSQQLLALINDVLDMSRIESGKMTLEESDVHLPDVVNDLRTIIQPNAAAKQLHLSTDMQEVVHEDVVTDKLRLSQILLNILSNAIKFTPAGGAIDFRVVEKPSDSPDTAIYEFHIKDNGIGMSEEFQKTIFEAFTREKSSTASGIQGTGLGMAITKSVVDTMGGTISIDSELGVGSEFVVELSFAIAESVAETEPCDAAGTAPEEWSFAGRRVLLAEDNEMNQTIAAIILSESGFEVEIASDGQEALEMVEAMPDGYFDAILMDVQMPRMDGYEATRRIRALDDPAKARIPIVAVTANAFEKDRDNALACGMDGHLAKPYDIPKMLETLAALMR